MNKLSVACQIDQSFRRFSPGASRTRIKTIWRCIGFLMSVCVAQSPLIEAHNNARTHL